MRAEAAGGRVIGVDRCRSVAKMLVMRRVCTMRLEGHDAAPERDQAEERE